uniref:OmpA/MotB domain protein n=1 Tax=Solibacter usitatus (strain Ellin6076) TaxID=234267 RepID=Q029L1_SOLUE
MKNLTMLYLATFGALVAQVPNPTQKQTPVDANTGQPMPIFRVTVVSRTTKAINYNHRNGSTPIDFRGTELMPAARGHATVDSKMGSTKIETRLEKMTPASQYGPEYMTYVLWAITPEGRANNLGEVVLQGDHANLLSTTDLQSFGLIVTAEPYFAVTQPSDVVVAENFVTKETEGTIQQVDAKYELLKRGQYVFNRSMYKPPRVDPKGPLQLGQAENAVEIARLAGADKYAADTFQKAVVDLQNAEDFLNGKSKDRKRAETNAREATQMAEDARIITFRKMNEEALANERAAAAAREADAKEKARLADEQARMDQQRRAQAEADQRASETARRQAEQAKLEADNARASAEKAAADAARERAAADAARLAAEQQQQAAMAEADRAKQGMQKAEAEKAELRERLRNQLNMILETRETARGLIINISDVLFDFNKYTLKPGAREKLAKVSGILLAYPGLNIKVEGHTDSIGSDEYNQKLSESRASSVRDYLTSQNVPADSVSAVGLGKSDPVASNDTAAGRQRNRRVELVVSGEPIGIGDISGPSSKQ